VIDADENAYTSRRYTDVVCFADEIYDECHYRSCPGLELGQNDDPVTGA